MIQQHQYSCTSAGQTADPDLDIFTTGKFTIAPVCSSIASETRQLTHFVIHDSEGQALSAITQEENLESAAGLLQCTSRSTGRP